jgi:DNA-binding protein H-NS
LNDLLKLRAEKRTAEIGFESQQRKQAEEARKQAVEKRSQELHKWKVLLAEAEVDNCVLRNLNLQTPEHRTSVGPERIIAAQNAA